jgi:pimeloyl-ACP methyl ester carboxylesterase
MTNLFSKQRGEGKPIILIHGFPMHQGVWDDFAERFVNSNTVITVDLPGFGKSPILPFSFSLDQVAEQMLRYLSEKEILDSVVIGHSLGGYVALAMIEKSQALFSGIGLFHSTAYADSAEKKESRTKVIEFVKKNGALAYTTNFIAPLFADPRHVGIEKVKRIAVQSSAEAVIGYSTAMRERHDQTKTLKSFKKPTLFLAGDKDPGIPVETVFKLAGESQRPDIHILRDVGHMGMFEKPDEAATKIKAFLSKT